MVSANRADRLFLICLAVLLVFGLIELMSASTPLGFAEYGNAYYDVERQLLFGVVPGLVLFFILARIDYHFWQKVAWVCYIGALFLTLLVYVPGIGAVINGSRSWLHFGGLSFQPSELVKLAIAIISAHLLADKKRDWSDWKNSIVPILGVLAPALLLILAQDIGTLSILVAIIFVDLFLAEVPGIYLAMLGLVGVVCFAALVIAAPYRVARLTTFLHPELDPKGIGYQMNQAFLAVGSGGPWGLGFGHSRQKYQYLPEVDSDSIFAVIAEEDGFFVSVGLIILLVAITWRGFKIAKGAADSFGYLLVVGIMVWLLWQSFLNIGAMVGALPLTGVPLPLVSHGGSALMTILAALGIVTNVSKTAHLQ